MVIVNLLVVAVDDAGSAISVESGVEDDAQIERLLQAEDFVTLVVDVEECLLEENGDDVVVFLEPRNGFQLALGELHATTVKSLVPSSLNIEIGGKRFGG